MLLFHESVNCSQLIKIEFVKISGSARFDVKVVRRISN